MTSFSALILTHNSERRLQQCLESLSWVDDLVIVDDESIDQTRAIAAEFGARIFTRDFDTFSGQRNFALAQCTGTWVIAIDSDETLTPELAAQLREAVQRWPDTGGFRMPRRNHLLGRWVRGCGWYPDIAVRCYRRDGAIYSGDVHEGLHFPGTVISLSGPVLHFPYESLEQYVAKLNRYSTMSAREAYAAGKHCPLIRLIMRPPINFLKHYLMQGGIFDGIPGLLVSALSAYYTLLKWSKLYYMEKAQACGTVTDEDAQECREQSPSTM